MTLRSLHHLGAALVLLAGGCRPAAPPVADDRTWTDVEGKPVRLGTLPVHRIVTTMQSVTEWLVLLGAANTLVARTDYDRQPVLAALPSIGGGLNPSPERILELAPDVVIGWRDRSSVDLKHALAPFHIPVLSFETTDTADALRNLHRLGVLVGREAAADSLAMALRSSLAEVKRTACDSGRDVHPSVFLLVSDDPPQTAGGRTWMTTVLETACLRNVFPDLPEPWATVSMESIAARDPDWILTSEGKAPGQRLAEFRGKPGWRELRAIRTGHLLEIPGDLFARSGPSIPEAARAIVAARRRIEGK
ncbi:MAG: helical backbone metal receptor [Gemmatimonadota bacterium]